MIYLANTGKLWRQGGLLSDEAFLSFGDVAAYEAARHEGYGALSFMTQFAHLILRGAFDCKPPDPVPFVDLMVIDQSLRHLQVPMIGALCDPKTGLSVRNPEFVGYGCANSDLVLRQLAQMHRWFEGGPQRDTPDELAAFANELLTREFETYPDVVQAFLNDTLIAKERLKEWYRLRGITVPWPGASNDNAMLNEPEEEVLYPSNDEQRVT